MTPTMADFVTTFSVLKTPWGKNVTNKGENSVVLALCWRLRTHHDAQIIIVSLLLSTPEVLRCLKSLQ